MVAILSGGGRNHGFAKKSKKRRNGIVKDREYSVHILTSKYVVFHNSISLNMLSSKPEVSVICPIVHATPKHRPMPGFTIGMFLTSRAIPPA